MKQGKPFWNVPAHQAPTAFNSFKLTPRVRKRFVVPMDSGHLEDPLEACPHCGSPNLEDQDSPAKGVFALSCQDCAHTWTALNPF